jgi:hypothetical protein
MRGFDPRIHGTARAGVAMDRRAKPGDDSWEEADTEGRLPGSPTAFRETIEEW